MGFCILPTPDLVVVDLDDKSKRESLIKAAQAEGHYIEGSPSGGAAHRCCPSGSDGVLGKW